ncbi:ATP-binding protein [Piscinibacter sakaiensis]|uniref:ATP-binding protein n=1 Tax=Piscinibacter sakaiensis TaxID=1547922 RepID=UPI001E50D27B|nr:ATP-binding protein [Piscinibacter sakaiensis]
MSAALRRPWLNSIRWRLLAWLVGLLVLGALAVGGVGYRSVLAETEALFDYQLRQMALSLRDQGEIGPAQAQALRNEELDFVVQIWTADGRSLYASRPHPTLPDRAVLGLADVSVDGETWRTYGVATGLRVIQVAQPRRIRRALAADAALRSVAPMLALAPLLALAMAGLASMTLRPLARVARDLRGRDEHTLAPLPEAGLPDELAPLVQALNQLLARLGRALDGQRAFVADAAHELRSPLTALTLQLAAVARAGDEPARRSALADLAAGIERSTHLVEQLLALARQEPGAVPAPDAPLDLAALAGEVLAQAVPQALARGATLDLQADAAVPLRGDAAALRLLLRNLVDNALRHGAPGGHVEVRVEADPAGGARLVVDDDGPGLPPAERTRVFDRFYRPAGTQAEGSGLGLAIVRGIAERHRARVVLDTAPRGGLRAEVRFPPAEGGAPTAEASGG